MAQAIPHDGTGAKPSVEPVKYRFTTPARGVRLGKIFGFEVDLDFSVLLILAMLVFNLGAGLLPNWHPDWASALRWSVAALAGVAFLASILAHELSHALVGRRFGVVVDRITLFMFGGVAHLRSEPKQPVHELFMAAAGPLASLAIGFLSIAAAMMLGADSTVVTDPEPALARLTPTATILLWLGPVNVVLGLFNLAPGFPLDGGRVLRATIWWATSDLRKATRWSALAGQAIAALLMVSGAMMTFGVEFPVLGGGLLNGVWLVLIGWFLGGAARSGYRELLVREVLQELPVSRLLNTRVVTVTPEISVEHFVRERVLQGGQRCFPVVSGERLQGLVSITDLRKLGPKQWMHASVGDIMTPAGNLATIGPDSDAAEALQLLAERDVNQLPVVAGGKFLGLVQRSDLVSWIGLKLDRFDRPMKSEG
jgi:Zn-dependent protease/CBS domain-containing protein